MKLFDTPSSNPLQDTIGHTYFNESTQDHSPYDELLLSLRNVLHNFLTEKKNRTLNRLSKTCKVSEPTLRRIYKGQIKTLPTSTTILDILTTITGETNTAKIAEIFPGPIATYLENLLPQSTDCSTEYNSDLHKELQDSVKYIIYKLSSNSSGVSKMKVNELFGFHGQQMAESLLSKGYLKLVDDCYYSNIENFTINQDHFVANFKLVSDFIKTTNPIAKGNLHSLLANYSESISPEAYKEIVTLQKKTLKKIREIMSSKSSKGHLPIFLLLAIDSLDTVPVHEFEA